MQSPQIEFGLDAFAPATRGADGEFIDGAQVLRNLVEEAVLAEEVGIDSFNVAEHYRPELMDSSAHVILGAIAGRTSTIKLGTAVTVLSTKDPVRVYTDAATLDAVSNGRSQLIVGRGSAIESFPLFGFDLADYEDLFEEKLDLLMRLLREQPVTWSGKWRSPLDDQVLNPPIPPGNVPVWVGVGGSPESVVRAARYGLPLMLAVIGGHASRFAPYADLHRRALEQYGFDPQPVGLHSTGLIADTDEAAVAIQWPAWEETMTREGLRRGWAPPTYDRFLAEVASGSIYAGAPETMAPRIAESMRILGATRFDFAYAPGHVSHEHRMRAIELLGREVVPQVRELLASRVELVETSPTRNAG